jgi:hypothetical protein
MMPAYRFVERQSPYLKSHGEVSPGPFHGHGEAHATASHHTDGGAAGVRRIADVTSLTQVSIVASEL